MNKLAPFPKAATVRQMRELFEEHEREGRADCIVMGRMMCFAIPPAGEVTFDAKRRQVYVNLIPE